ncbi:MAG: hypothetical protein H6Q84_2897 [Deltaproteobacteria bacterium]|nr:hypothetical protein [Deltaproteobacteria bacterium]
MREHVTPFIFRVRPELFRIVSVRDARDNPEMSWTVNTQEDLKRVRHIYEDLGLWESFLPYPEILAAVLGKG